MLCNGQPTEGDQGVTGATVLKPATPMESLIWLRMGALPGLGRMPRIGSDVVDQNGVMLMRDWIALVASCPQ
jgi:hypothetical protein